MTGSVAWSGWCCWREGWHFGARSAKRIANPGLSGWPSTTPVPSRFSRPASAQCTLQIRWGGCQARLALCSKSWSCPDEDACLHVRANASDNTLKRGSTRAEAAGVSHDNPSAQTCTFDGRGTSNTTKIPRRHPVRDKKSEMGAGGHITLLFGLCNSLAQAKVPAEVASVLMGARFTALSKPDGGVRVTTSGCSLRRLVARVLAKQFVKVCRVCTFPVRSVDQDLQMFVKESESCES